MVSRTWRMKTERRRFCNATVFRPVWFCSYRHSKKKKTGTEDYVVSHEWGALTRKKLQDLGVGVEFKSYRGMGHSASDEVFFRGPVMHVNLSL